MSQECPKEKCFFGFVLVEPPICLATLTNLWMSHLKKENGSVSQKVAVHADTNVLGCILMPKKIFMNLVSKKV
jgi:hypothetical protein